jgi:hypothetical protein
MLRKSDALAKMVGGYLLSCLFTVSSVGPTHSQETTFPSLIGEWNHIDTGQSIIVRKNGDVLQTRGPQARVQAGVIDHGGDFAFEGKDNDGRSYRCVYKINFLVDGRTNWRNVFHSGSWTCPSGVYVRIAGSLTADPPLVLTFRGNKGGPFTPPDLSVSLLAEGYRLGWRLEGNRPSWLDISPTKGEVPSDGSTEVKLKIQNAGQNLSPGTYDATVTFEGEHVGVVQRTIRLIVTPPTGSPGPAESTPDEAIADTRLKESIQGLDALLGPARGRVRVGMQGGNRVSLGKQYRLEADAKIGGQLVVIDVDANQKVSLIYPNDFLAVDDSGHIEVGAPVSIPADNYSGALTAFEAVEPIGKGLLLAFVVPEGFKVERSVASKSVRGRGMQPVADPTSYLLTFSNQIKKWFAAKSSAGVDASKELERWGFSVTEYEIVR